MHPENPDSGSSSARPPKPRKRVGLSRFAEERLKQKLRRTTCSEPWVEAQFVSVTDRDKDRSSILYRYHDAKIYPPGGQETAMIRCPVCGVFTPPGAIEHGKCLDHANHEGYGPSPSGLAFQALQFYNLHVEESVELAPEDAASLRREIQNHLSRRKNRKDACESRKRKRHKQ